MGNVRKKTLTHNFLHKYKLKKIKLKCKIGVNYYLRKKWSKRKKINRIFIALFKKNFTKIIKIFSFNSIITIVAASQNLVLPKYNIICSVFWSCLNKDSYQFDFSQAILFFNVFMHLYDFVLRYWSIRLWTNLSNKI